METESPSGGALDLQKESFSSGPRERPTMAEGVAGGGVGSGRRSFPVS